MIYLPLVGFLPRCGLPGLYTAKPYNTRMLSFVETRLFTRLVQEYLSDEEYLALQEFLTEHPETGAVISVYRERLAL